MEQEEIIRWIQALENDQAWEPWEVGEYAELRSMRKDLAKLLKQYLEIVAQISDPIRWYSGILKLAPGLAKDKDWRLEDDPEDLHFLRKSLARNLERRLEELKAELESLSLKEKGKLLRKLASMVGQDAEDVFQIAFIKAFEGIANLADPKKLKGWFWVVAMNAGRSARRAGQEPPQPIDDDYPGEGNDPLGQMHAVEVYNAVAKAIDDLPSLQRQCFRLWYYGPDEGETYSYKDIAKLLHISAEQVKRHIYQARQKLKRVALEAGKGI